MQKISIKIAYLLIAVTQNNETSPASGERVFLHALLQLKLRTLIRLQLQHQNGSSCISC